MEKFYDLVFALYRKVLNAKVRGEEIPSDFNRNALKEVACEITRRKITNEPTHELNRLIEEINKMTDIVLCTE